LGKFSLGKWDLGHWDWDLVTGDGNHRQKNNRTGTVIFKIWKNNRLGNGVWAEFGLEKWDLYPPSGPSQKEGVASHESMSLTD